MQCEAKVQFHIISGGKLARIAAERVLSTNLSVLDCAEGWPVLGLLEQFCRLSGYGGCVCV